MPERLLPPHQGQGSSPDDYVGIQQLLERLVCLNDPILHSKIIKAISLLGRTFALYR
jgi:hypothetical protein